MADEKVKVSSLVTVAPKTTDKVLITTTDDSGQLQTRNALVSDIRNLAASLEDSEDKAINVKIANEIVKKVTDLAGEVDTSFETVNQNFTNVNDAISQNRDNITTANENMTAHEEDTDLHVTAEKQQKWDGYDQSIKDVKEIADENTAQLNESMQNINTLQTNKIDKSKIVNNLSATETGFVLDATQGKYLNDSLNKLLTLKNMDWIDQITQTGIYSIAVTATNKFQFPADNSIGDVYVIYAIQRQDNASLLCMQLGFSRLAYNNLTISTKTLGTWKVL